MKSGYSLHRSEQENRKSVRGNSRHLDIQVSRGANLHRKRSSFRTFLWGLATPQKQKAHKKIKFQVHHCQCCKTRIRLQKLVNNKVKVTNQTLRSRAESAFASVALQSASTTDIMPAKRVKSASFQLSGLLVVNLPSICCLNSFVIMAAAFLLLYEADGMVRRNYISRTECESLGFPFYFVFNFTFYLFQASVSFWVCWYFLSD